MGAVLGEAPGIGLADAGGSTCDDRDLVLMPFAHDAFSLMRPLAVIASGAKQSSASKGAMPAGRLLRSARNDNGPEITARPS
jgi:hypothetical protein